MWNYGRGKVSIISLKVKNENIAKEKAYHNVRVCEEDISSKKGGVDIKDHHWGTTNLVMNSRAVLKDQKCSRPGPCQMCVL